MYICAPLTSQPVITDAQTYTKNHDSAFLNISNIKVKKIMTAHFLNFVLKIKVADAAGVGQYLNCIAATRIEKEIQNCYSYIFHNELNILCTKKNLLAALCMSRIEAYVGNVVKCIVSTIARVY